LLRKKRRFVKGGDYVQVAVAVKVQVNVDVNAPQNNAPF
jgi:hypothetical protein